MISYNPGYQSAIKDLKESTKQRFGAIDFDYPEKPLEAAIVAHESKIDVALAETLIDIAARSRNLRGAGLDEGASTRMLIYAGRLIGRGIPIAEACEVALVTPVTDDVDIRDALRSAVSACLQ